jgi:LmbE family N-acetylglucosaminyl deacetylase
MPQVVLVIAPHPDDESIGCGGALCLHHQRGDRIHVVFLTSGELGLQHLVPHEAWQVREREAAAAAEVLGVAKLTFLRLPDWFVGAAVEQAGAALRPILEHEVPELIYLPHPSDGHPDHRAALPVVRAALGPQAQETPGLRGYEVWTPLRTCDHWEDITPVMARKLRAVRCHASQTAQIRYDRAVRGLNQYRGIVGARCRYAEVFGAVPLATVRKGQSREPTAGSGP